MLNGAARRRFVWKEGPDFKMAVSEVVMGMTDGSQPFGWWTLVGVLLLLAWAIHPGVAG
jgi:hypothetical protein